MLRRTVPFLSMREKLFRLLQTPWFIALIALLVRVAWLVYKIAIIPKEALAVVPFENEVGNVASALANGQGFCCLFRQPTGPTAWLTPVYPLLIAGVFMLFGTFTFSSFVASVSLNSLFSALASFPLYYASERITGKPVAVLGAWLWVFSPIAIVLPYAWIWDSSLSALLAAAILWATIRVPDRPGLPAFVLYGLLWGFSLLINPALGALLPFLLAWIFFGLRTENSRRLRLTLVALAATVVLCLPWTLRNYIQFHRFVPLRSNFAYEFWSGNNEIFDPHSHEVNRITRYEQTRLYAHLGETAFLTEKWQSAEQFVRTHPSLYAQLCARRIVATWLGTDSPWHDFLYADSSLAQFLLLWSVVSFLALLVGLVRLYRSSRFYFFPVAAFPLIFPITFYLAHTSLRHRHPCDPVIALLMAVAFLGARGTNPAGLG
jgi:Dolichyl-phosphate-mannose-protein mannosyltransferase